MMGQIELVLTVLVTLACAVSSQVAGGYYQTKYDALDVEDVLNHKRLVHHYASCLLNRGPCPPQGADLKRILPESLETTCLRCTEKQKVIILKTIRRLRAEYPSLWKELVDYYDPSEERIQRIEFSIDKSSFGDDESNFIGNRFGDDSGNDLAGPLNPVSEGSTYPPPPPPPPPTSPRPGTAARPSSTSRPSTAARPSSTSRPSTAARPSSTAKPTTVARPSTTTRPTTIAIPSTTIITSGSTAKPLSFSPSNDLDIVDDPTTQRPSFFTRWRLTTVPIDNGPPYGWRPNEPTLPPFNIKVDAGIRLLSDIGTRFLQAGTEVAGMVLSTVQQVFGAQPVN